MISQQDSMIRNVEVFSGSADPAEARIYAVAAIAEEIRHEPKQFQWSGHLIGPECEFAHTLSARIPFTDRGTDETLLAEAIIPDPCFWTPELPFLYRAVLELRQTDNSLVKIERTIGIRRLGIRGRQLFFEGQRFVLRGIGIHFDWESPSDLGYLRQTWTAVLVSRPNQEVCEFASKRGILIVADLRTSRTNSGENIAAETVRSVAHWPAVVMAIVDADMLPSIETRGAVRNVLIGQYIRAEEPLSAAENAQIIFAEVDEPGDFAHQARNCNRPVVAVRRLAQQAKIETAREAVDALQRDLAPFGDFAGYIV
ncbi:MAG TPA: hypothetical protein VGI75_04420 [Pirellulales bacterium]